MEDGIYSLRIWTLPPSPEGVFLPRYLLSRLEGRAALSVAPETSFFSTVRHHLGPGGFGDTHGRLRRREHSLRRGGTDAPGLSARGAAQIPHLGPSRLAAERAPQGRVVFSEKSCDWFSGAERALSLNLPQLSVCLTRPSLAAWMRDAGVPSLRK